MLRSGLLMAQVGASRVAELAESKGATIPNVIISIESMPI